MIDKNLIALDSEKAKERVPETVGFLIIIVKGYPAIPPKILTKSNFCTPSLMDGRDLLEDICPKWDSKIGIKPLIDMIPKFVGKVVNAKGYKFYGTFHLGAIYNLKNFENMIVSILNCKVVENDNKNMLIKSLNTKSNSDNARIAFWSTLFSITDLLLNKRNKTVSINFYDEETNSEYQLKLEIDNILLFRDSLVKKMKILKVKVESQKLIKGKQQQKRLTEKEIKAMKINDIEKNAKELNQRIEKGEINDYTVNTFTNLCGKAIEYYSRIGDKKYEEYVKMMKDVLQKEKVNNLTMETEKEIKDVPD